MDTQRTQEPLIKTIDGNAYVKYGDYHALQQQRDELLDALKNEHGMYSPALAGDFEGSCSICTLIAKAGG